MATNSMVRENSIFSKTIDSIADSIRHLIPVGSTVFIDDFSDFDGLESYFGKYIALEINERLSKSSDFSLSDRNSLRLRIKEYDKKNDTADDSKIQFELAKYNGSTIAVRGIITEYVNFFNIETKIIRLRNMDNIGKINYRIEKNRGVTSFIATIIQSSKNQNSNIEKLSQKVIEEINLEIKKNLIFIDNERTKILDKIDNDRKEKLALLEREKAEIMEKVYLERKEIFLSLNIEKEKVLKQIDLEKKEKLYSIENDRKEMIKQIEIERLNKLEGLRREELYLKHKITRLDRDYREKSFIYKEYLKKQEKLKEVQSQIAKIHDSINKVNERVSLLRIGMNYNEVRQIIKDRFRPDIYNFEDEFPGCASFGKYVLIFENSLLVKGCKIGDSSQPDGKGNVVSDCGGCDHYGTPNIIKF